MARHELNFSQKISMIAIVDDDAAVRQATQSFLRSLDYHVSTFGSANEYLKSEKVHDTSCVITDLHMPELSGLDLQDQLIARGHHIPIIFITGYPDDIARARAMKAGAVCFLSKPYNHDHLLGYLDQALKAA